MAKNDPLKTEFRRRVAELSRRAEVPEKGEVEELERLAKLIAWRGGAPAWRRRLPAAVAAVIAMCVLSFLFFNHRQRTLIELVVSSPELELGLAEDQRILLGGALESLGISGAQGARLPRAAGQSLPRTLSGDPRLALKLSRPDSPAGGSLGVDSVALAAGYRVRLQTLPDTSAVRVLVEDRPTQIGGTVRGQVLLSIAGGGRRMEEFGVGGRFEAWGEGLALDLRPRDTGRSFLLARHLEIDHLDLHAVEHYEVGERTRARRVGAIESGRLYFEELGGEERQLRGGDRLRWSRVDGWVRELAVEDGAFRLAFTGEVEGMTTGPETAPHDLMPTQLQWLRAQHSWVLLWGSGVSLVGFLLGLMRWWSA